MHKGKTKFACKDNNMEMGARDLYIDEAHTVLDIFLFAVFLRSSSL